LGGGRFQEFRRTELLSRAWSAMERQSAETGDLFYVVLRLKSDDPARTSAAPAAELSGRRG